jgi:DNA invertase Pin-like site-specific DNA recombinase
MKIAAYIRVSTDDQKTDSQLDAIKNYCKLKGWNDPALFIDHGESGKKESRPQLDEMVKGIKARQFDTVLVYKFDRISRSTKHLIEIMEMLKALEINFVSITESIDTTTPAGKMIFGIFAVLAEFERENIVSRVKAGMKAAKERGIHCGRSNFKLTKEQHQSIIERGLSGESVSKLADEFSINKGTVSRMINKVRRDRG